MTTTKSTRTVVTPPAEGPPENTFRTLVRAFGLLGRVMHPYFARFGISASQWGVLRTLHRAEQERLPGVRLTDLSDRLLIRPPSVTGVVDRLQRMGLVARDALQSDLRVRQVSLTDKGRHLVEQVLCVHQAQVGSILSGLAPQEQAQLRRLLGRLIEHLEQLAQEDGVPDTAPAAGSKIERVSR